MNDQNSVIFFVYNHEKQEFQPSPKQIANAQLLELGDIGKIEEELTKNNIDALLVWDANKSKWYLVFGSHTGIVIQRTARRHADTMARTGYRGELGKIMPGFPLEELSESNIGDLWKSAQMKYVKTDLKGAEVTPPDNTRKTITTKQETAVEERIQADEKIVSEPLFEKVGLDEGNKETETVEKEVSYYEPVTIKKESETISPKQDVKNVAEQSQMLSKENVLTISLIKHFIKGGSTWVVVNVDEPPYKHFPIVFSPSDFDNYTFISKILFLKEGNKIVLDLEEKDGIYYAKSLKIVE